MHEFLLQVSTPRLEGPSALHQPRHRLHHLYTNWDRRGGHHHHRYKIYLDLFRIILSTRRDLLLTSDPGLRLIKFKYLISNQFILSLGPLALELPADALHAKGGGAMRHHHWIREAWRMEEGNRRQRRRWRRWEEDERVERRGLVLGIARGRGFD
jgi:hypothetical protein